MKISIVTLFPRMIAGFMQESILKRAEEKGHAQIDLIDLRSYAKDSYKTVDDRPYGGGAGMVLRADIVFSAIASIMETEFQEIIPYQKEEYLALKKRLQAERPFKIVMTSPRGIPFTQSKAQEYAALNNLILFAGHYEAVDERIQPLIDEEVSMGDFVLTGGEIAAAAIADATVRLLPGVLKKKKTRYRMRALCGCR